MTTGAHGDGRAVEVEAEGACLHGRLRLVLAITLTWTFFSMRAVMNVGGSCADGGPYVSAQPCPDGSC